MNWKSVVILASVFFWKQLSFASFDITPIIMSVSPSGPDASVSLTITNTGDAKTPVQISVYKREPDLEGKEAYHGPSTEGDSSAKKTSKSDEATSVKKSPPESNEAGDLFQIIPSQFILGPKEKRTVRVTYVGEPKLKEELPFRVIAEEFPIDITDPNRVKNKAVASISILSKYVTSLYVKPIGVMPDISIEAIMSKENKENKMVLMFQNKGTEHKILKNMKYKVTTVSDKKEFLLPTESEQAIGSQNILAGKTRKFTIPWPKGIPMVPVKVAIDTTAK